MKIVILAGGLGTRLSEYTKTIPKPMIKIRNKPIITHILNHYKSFGFDDFIIAAGYKGKIIKNYFKKNKFNSNIRVIDTGLKTMTGGRIRRLKKLLNNETFMLTYGDGLSNIDINKLIKFHANHKKIVTISAVRPPARFGSLSLSGSDVLKFKEKTSCPVIVNTSFNVRGEPIVNTPTDAFNCFMGTELDYLVIGNCILDKNEQNQKQKNNYLKNFELD